MIPRLKKNLSVSKFHTQIIIKYVKPATFMPLLVYIYISLDGLNINNVGDIFIDYLVIIFIADTKIVRFYWKFQYKRKKEVLVMKITKFGL